MLDNMPRGTICIEDIEIGMSRHLSKVVTDRDIELFAEVSTDRNPVHLDDSYAAKTRFGHVIAHGMLSAGFVSAALGTQLAPHAVVIYLSQSLRFRAPVSAGDTLTATVTAKELNVERSQVTLDTVVTNQEGTQVLTGEALVMVEAPKA